MVGEKLSRSWGSTPGWGQSKLAFQRCGIVICQEGGLGGAGRNLEDVEGSGL